MIRRELGLFLIVGCLTAVIDFFTYRGLFRVGGAGIEIAKGAGFLLGSVFSYFANRFCTFSTTVHQPGSHLRFGLLYAGTLGANVIVNAVVWKLLTEARAAMEVAFLFATGISASLNFIGMKRFVFKAGGAKELQ